jgi:hypothetical protein
LGMTGRSQGTSNREKPGQAALTWALRSFISSFRTRSSLKCPTGYP